MNLLETLINNGQTFSVTHNKSNVDMSTKLVSISLKKEDISTINYDLKLTVKENVSKFEMSENFFNSIPQLKVVGTGIREILHGNELYILICDKDAKNPFSLSPVSLASMKGAEKSLTFKNDAILAGIEIAKISEVVEGVHYFSLNPTEVENVYKVEKTDNSLKVSVPVNDILNSEVIENKIESSDITNQGLPIYDKEVFEEKNLNILSKTSSEEISTEETEDIFNI